MFGSTTPVLKHQKRVSNIKRGAVICVEGKTPNTWSKVDEFSFREQFSKFDSVQITTSELMPFMFQKIWLNMIAKGITDLVVVKAKFRGNGKLELSFRICRLPMIGMS